MKKIKFLIKFCLSFGLINGCWLFIRFQFGFIKNIKLTAIKHPFDLRDGIVDTLLFNEVFLNKQYSSTYVKDPKVIIDCGANIGLFGIVMKNKFPKTKIISIEPDLDNYLLLKKNLLPYDNMYFENSGIWNKDSKLKVFDKFNRGKWGIIVEENEEEGNVSAISLNTLLNKYEINRVDILKIDIETSEKQLFSDNYQEWLPKIKTIVIELHDGFEDGCSRAFFEAINKSIKRYRLHTTNCENIIIENLDLE